MQHTWGDIWVNSVQAFLLHIPLSLPVLVVDNVRVGAGALYDLAGEAVGAPGAGVVQRGVALLVRRLHLAALGQEQVLK